MNIKESMLNNKRMKVVGLLCVLMSAQVQGVEDIEAESDAAELDKRIVHLDPYAIAQGTYDVMSELLPELAATCVLLSELVLVGNEDGSLDLSKLANLRYKIGLFMAAAAKVGLKTVDHDLFKGHNSTEERAHDARVGMANMARFYAEQVGWIKGAMHSTVENSNVYVGNLNGAFSLSNSMAHYTGWLAVGEFIVNADVESIKNFAVAVKAGDTEIAGDILNEWRVPVARHGLIALGKAYVTAVSDKAMQETFVPLMTAFKEQGVTDVLPWKQVFSDSYFLAAMVGGIAFNGVMVPEVIYQLGLNDIEVPEHVCDRRVTSKQGQELISAWIARTFMFGMGFKVLARNGIAMNQLNPLGAVMWFVAFAEFMELGPMRWIYNSLPDQGDPINQKCHEWVDGVEGEFEKDEL